MEELIKLLDTELQYIRHKIKGNEFNIIGELSLTACAL